MNNLILVDSPYVVKLIEYFINDLDLYLVMEYIEGKTISQYINSSD